MANLPNWLDPNRSRSCYTKSYTIMQIPFFPPQKSHYTVRNTT